MASDNFKHLVLTHYESMYRVAYSILRDKDDALDAVQDAVTSLWEKRTQLAGIENHEAFCLRAVRNRCIDMLRSRAGMHDTLDDTPDCHDSMQDIVRDVETRDSLRLVNAIVESLPPLQRQVIRLRSEACCDLHEIAEITGVSHDNARTILSRARRKIKELYDNIK